MTPTTIKKIRDKTGYSLEIFIQVVKADYQDLMSYNQIGRKYNISHKLVGEVLRLGGLQARNRIDAVTLSYKQRLQGDNNGQKSN